MTRIALLLLLSLSSACVSTPEKAPLRRGVTVRPVPAPVFTPTEDAPHTRGQPGAIDPDGKTLPPSPNKRQAQPRRDGQPQLMAADGDDARAVALMLTAPVPATPEGIAPSAWVKCWRDFQRLAREDERFRALTHEEAKCLRNRVLSHCGARMIEHADAGNEDFLKRFPPRPMDAQGQSPRSGRTAGVYDEHAFTEAMDGRRNARVCGPNHEYWTDRVGRIAPDMTERGDDKLDWRDP